MNVVSLTMTYPTATWPARGQFIRRRLESMARHMRVRIIAPRPWFPLLPPAPHGTPPEEWLDARRPRMFYVPRVLKFTDPWFYAAAVRREMTGLPPRDQPDLIDAHYEWPDGPAAAGVARRLGLPFVVTLRGKLRSHAVDPLRRRQMRDMLRRADARIAVSRDLARRAAELAGDGRPVAVIPNGIDAAIFQPADRVAARRRLGLDPAPRYLVSVGYVQELKGFDRVVDALPEIRARCGDVRLLLLGNDVGESDYVRRLAALIESRRLGYVVHRASHATPQRTADYLNAADLFVLSTRSEGWCNAIHESLACGTPVVTTDVGGNRELVRTPDEGRLVPFGDRIALRDAVIDALRHSWPREAIAARAASRSWDDVGREVYDLFREVLAARRSPRRPAPTDPSRQPAANRLCEA